MTSRKAILFCASQCGLANRLRAFVGYQAASNLLGVPFLVQWKQDHSCGDEFSRLFQAEGVHLVTLAEAKSLLRSREAEVYSSVPWFTDLHTRVIPDIGRIEYMREVGRCLVGLRPAECIRESAGAFIGTKLSPFPIGFHIRHTDNLTGYARWLQDSASGFEQHKVSNLEGFNNLMTAECKRGRRFAVATDDSDLERKLLERHGPMMTSFPKGWGMGRLSEGQEAVADMLVLGRCNRVVGTYFSSFGQFSALWGGADYCEMQGSVCVDRPPFQRIIEELRETEASSRYVCNSSIEGTQITAIP